MCSAVVTTGRGWNRCPVLYVLARHVSRTVIGRPSWREGWRRGGREQKYKKHYVHLPVTVRQLRPAARRSLLRYRCTSYPAAPPTDYLRLEPAHWRCGYFPLAACRALRDG